MSITDDPFADFLDRNSGDTHTPFKFERIGDTLAGEIIERPRTVGVPNKFKGGAIEEKAVVAVRDRNGQTWALWVKAGALAGALRKATEEHGPGCKLEKGGMLAVQFSATKPTDKGNDQKLYVAQYRPPAPPAQQPGASGVGDLLGGQPQQSYQQPAPQAPPPGFAPQPQVYQQPAPAPAPAQPLANLDDLLG